MSDIDIRITGRAGRITFTRPQALNAMSYDMCMAVDAAMRQWRDDDEVALVVIDAQGDKAFCAGGDIAALYDTGTKGDFAYARRFWRDEYRLNAFIAEFPKPVVSLMQGFTMGGGVGIGCHGGHRVVDDSTRIAMPECGIGLIPDVGGCHLLSRAPGYLGEYLGLTAGRMAAGDAILAGFADHFIPREKWADLIEMLEASGDIAHVAAHALPAPPSSLGEMRADIDRHFGGGSLQAILDSLSADDSDFAQKTRAVLARNAPLSMACTVEMLRRLRAEDATIRQALDLEYRFTWRSMEDGDFLEGIRAQIIDKDRNPKWQYAGDTGPEAVPDAVLNHMLAPLGADALTFEGENRQMKIGFIGLGNMGGPMAANLAKAGHDVTGFDMADVTIAGVKMAGSAAEAAKGADVVITMLPNGQILRAVAADIIPAMDKGATFVDCSTVDVDSARAVAQQAEEAGLLAVDAPVSGGTGGASGGTLTFMAGGSDAAFAKAKPLFDIMGQKAVHCGAAGAGQSAKICNNMILGVTMIATCEAFALADKLGLDRQKMFDVVSTSSGYSWTMNAYCPAPGVGPQSPADNDYKPGFAADLMLKDLRLSQQAAESADADTPMGALAQALYAQFVENEDGKGMDFSAMLPRFEKRGHSE
ncbi:3-hydroxyisobutyrate dehydrogenase [Antarcticimicrobium sediminis]|uniref:3-hydroxyisobutyrate dehydrogenase n=2 Tax=Antarcticimicrobium sediminis TaxID=2546227 RepID=A0A4V2Z8G9_9RHOB|nr:3-hydroxyisobutyrate dehydrogenase [Antarcticimicrobium sediminis]TDE40366.1 3-hydroxyisobutyrate dehydrogenase [Antarcticimicrobium sediminis]